MNSNRTVNAAERQRPGSRGLSIERLDREGIGLPVAFMTEEERLKSFLRVQCADKPSALPRLLENAQCAFALRSQMHTQVQGYDAVDKTRCEEGTETISLAGVKLGEPRCRVSQPFRAVTPGLPTWMLGVASRDKEQLRTNSHSDVDVMEEAQLCDEEGSTNSGDASPHVWKRCGVSGAGSIPEKKINTSCPLRAVPSSRKVPMSSKRFQGHIWKLVCVKKEDSCTKRAESTAAEMGAPPVSKSLGGQESLEMNNRSTRCDTLPDSGATSRPRRITYNTETRPALPLSKPSAQGTTREEESVTRTQQVPMTQFTAEEPSILTRGTTASVSLGPSSSFASSLGSGKNLELSRNAAQNCTRFDDGSYKSHVLCMAHSMRVSSCLLCKKKMLRAGPLGLQSSQERIDTPQACRLHIFPRLLGTALPWRASNLGGAPNQAVSGVDQEDVTEYSRIVANSPKVVADAKESSVFLQFCHFSVWKGAELGQGYSGRVYRGMAFFLLPDVTQKPLSMVGKKPGRAEISVNRKETIPAPAGCASALVRTLRPIALKVTKMKTSLEEGSGNRAQIWGCQRTQCVSCGGRGPHIREFETLKYLYERGVPVPEPIGWTLQTAKCSNQINRDVSQTLLLTMELIEGHTLKEWINLQCGTVIQDPLTGRTLHPSETLSNAMARVDVALGLVSALEKLHRFGIFVDLKPRNIMVTWDNAGLLSNQSILGNSINLSLPKAQKTCPADAGICGTLLSNTGKVGNNSNRPVVETGWRVTLVDVAGIVLRRDLLGQKESREKAKKKWAESTCYKNLTSCAQSESACVLLNPQGNDEKLKSPLVGAGVLLLPEVGRHAPTLTNRTGSDIRAAGVNMTKYLLLEGRKELLNGSRTPEMLDEAKGQIEIESRIFGLSANDTHISKEDVAIDPARYRDLLETTCSYLSPELSAIVVESDRLNRRLHERFRFGLWNREAYYRWGLKLWEPFVAAVFEKIAGRRRSKHGRCFVGALSRQLRRKKQHIRAAYLEKCFQVVWTSLRHFHVVQRDEQPRTPFSKPAFAVATQNMPSCDGAVERASCWHSRALPPHSPCGSPTAKDTIPIGEKSSVFALGLILVELFGGTRTGLTGLSQMPIIVDWFTTRGTRGTGAADNPLITNGCFLQDDGEVHASPMQGPPPSYPSSRVARHRQPPFETRQSGCNPSDPMLAGQTQSFLYKQSGGGWPSDAAEVNGLARSPNGAEAADCRNTLKGSSLKTSSPQSNNTMTPSASSSLGSSWSSFFGSGSTAPSCTGEKRKKGCNFQREAVEEPQSSAAYEFQLALEWDIKQVPVPAASNIHKTQSLKLGWPREKAAADEAVPHLAHVASKAEQDIVLVSFRDLFRMCCYPKSGLLSAGGVESSPSASRDLRPVTGEARSPFSNDKQIASERPETVVAAILNQCLEMDPTLRPTYALLRRMLLRLRALLNTQGRTATNLSTLINKAEFGSRHSETFFLEDQRKTHNERCTAAQH